MIEVDGITHMDDETDEKDKRKTRDLESAGFKVIRFTDEDVLKNMSGVMERIEMVVEDPFHPLSPRQRGTVGMHHRRGNSPLSPFGGGERGRTWVITLYMSNDGNNHIKCGVLIRLPLAAAGSRRLHACACRTHKGCGYLV